MEEQLRVERRRRHGLPTTTISTTSNRPWRGMLIQCRCYRPREPVVRAITPDAHVQEGPTRLSCEG